MLPLVDGPTKLETNGDHGEDFNYLASSDSFSDDEDLNDENDALNVSCHGNHFKRLKDNPKQSDELTIKRRKFHTQMDLMNSILQSMALGERRGQSVTSTPFNKNIYHARKISSKRLARKAKSSSGWSKRVKFCKYAICHSWLPFKTNEPLIEEKALEWMGWLSQRDKKTLCYSFAKKPWFGTWRGK